MGECAYFLKAKFATNKKASAAAKRLKQTLAEVEEAYSFWQKNRGKNSAEFWSKFEAEFPLSTEILKAAGVEIGRDCNNGLSENLSYCGEGQHVSVVGNEIRYSAVVWHLADWEGLAKWIENALEAKAVVWASEECMDPFDGLAYEK
jgi:hypothetical protein